MKRFSFQQTQTLGPKLYHETVWFHNQTTLNSDLRESFSRNIRVAVRATVIRSMYKQPI